MAVKDRRWGRDGTHKARHQRHNGLAVRALTTTPKSASREAGSDLRLRSDSGAVAQRLSTTDDAGEGHHAPPS